MVSGSDTSAALVVHRVAGVASASRGALHRNLRPLQLLPTKALVVAARDDNSYDGYAAEMKHRLGEGAAASTRLLHWVTPEARPVASEGRALCRL